MFRRVSFRVGILFAILPWGALSCGSTTPTEPGPPQSLSSAPAPEIYLTSPQRESRELLIDGRATPIEWDIAGPATYVRLRGDLGGGGGDFVVALRSCWSYDRFGAEKAIYFLLQWPDVTPDYLDRPLINDGVDILDDQGNPAYDCQAGDDGLIQPTNWHRSSIQEDQVILEIFSDETGAYPADNWRWGAGTTDPVTPSPSAEFQGAIVDGDTLGQTVHPAAGFMEDRWDQGGGPTPDLGSLCHFDNFTSYPNGLVPLVVASKGSRDTRLNRGHPVAYTVWSYVATRLTACDSLNPVRVDDSAERDKTWNPGDYVPSSQLIFPDSSQLDVIARGVWNAGKWGLEVRRDLETFYKNGETLPGAWTPKDDDVKLVTGRRYAMRITIYNASLTRGSRSGLIPLYLKPRS